MAIIKAVKSGKSLGNLMNYVDKKAKLTYGKDCSDYRIEALKEMNFTKEVWQKESGRQYKHYIQSFSPSESKQLSAKQVNELGQKWAEVNFEGYEVFIATHTDRGHFHNHFVVNSVNFETGRKIHLDKKDLEQFKSVSDKLCQERGLSVIDRKECRNLGDIRTYDMKKYQVMLQGKSYLLKAAFALNKALKQCHNSKEFIQQMTEKGYQVSWAETRKHITLTNAEGKKIRTSNLAKTLNEPKFTKEGMEHEFSRNREKREARSRYSERGITGKEFNQSQSRLIRYEESRSIRTIQDRKFDAEKSISNIERKLHNLKERTRYNNQQNAQSNQIARTENRKIRRKQYDFTR